MLIILSCLLLALLRGSTGLSGFPKQQTIKGVATGLSERIYYYNKEYGVYPQLKFSCVSVFQNFTLLSYVESGQTYNISLILTIQVPVRDGNTAEDCVEYTVNTSHDFNTKLASRSSMLRPLRFSLPDVVQVPEGTILGLQNSGGNILYQKSSSNDLDGFVSCNDLEDEEYFPVMSIEHRCRCDSCSSGFTNLKEIVEKESEVSYSFSGISVIPDMVFTKPGIVTSWTIAARQRISFDEDEAEVPHIQIWRPAVQNNKQLLSRSDFTEFHVVESREIHLHEDETDVKVEPEIVVEAGDVVGIKQPKQSELYLVFVTGNLTNYITTDTDSEELSTSFDSVKRTPLISPQFIPSWTSSSPSPTPEPSNSPAPSQSLIPGAIDNGTNSTRRNTELPVVVIVGGVLGPVVIGLILCIVISSAAFFVWKMKKLKSKESSGKVDSVIGNNPVYEAPTNESLGEPFYIAPTTHSTVLYESIDVPQVYEVPTTITQTQSQSDLDTCHTYHVLEAPRNLPHSKSTAEDNNA